MSETTISPGRPGRGYDPTAGFTDLQWYLFHQRNIAYFAAFSSRDCDRERAVATARALVTMLPHLGEGCAGSTPGMPPRDDVLERLVSIDTLVDFEGLPDAWLGNGMEVYSDPALPFFRIRIGRLVGGPDAQGRRSFLLVHVSHALAVGTDSARLSRSRPAAHPLVRAVRATRPPTASG